MTTDPTTTGSTVGAEDPVERVRARMLLDFCAALDAAGIVHVILSGYQDYPQRIDSDVDFMVSEADFDC